MNSVSQSPTDPAFVQDPYPFYERARGVGDIVWWDEYGMAVAFGHAAATEILKSRSMGRAPAGGHRRTPPEHLRDFHAIDDLSMLELDGPHHTRLRRRVVGAFTTSRVMAMSTLISQVTDSLIADFPDGPFDFIERFAERLPVTVIARLLGVPEEMGPQLLGWSHAMVAMYQARRDRALEDAANAAAQEFGAYLGCLIHERRRNPRDDLLSDLIASGGEEDGLTHEELVATAILLLNAGHEATVHTLGNGLFTLLRLHQPYEAVMPHGVATAVEELLRFDPPLHLFVRVAHEPVEIMGYHLAAGEKVGVCLGAANRDPRVWAAPEVFDPTRPPKSNLAFGAGAHFCVGAPLARLELQIALPAVFSPAVAPRLAESPRYADRYHFHGLERLMIERTGP